MSIRKVLDTDYSSFVIGTSEGTTRFTELNESVLPVKKGFCIISYPARPGEKFQVLSFGVGETKELELSSYELKNEAGIKLKSALSKQEYIGKIKHLKKEIQQGNIYEINYCMEFYAEGMEIDPLSVYFKLNQLANAPYSRLVKAGEDYIICASPELFLKREKNFLYTKPIKGTIKRGSNKEEDGHLKGLLYNSVKERTENVMAVDVARNDLSRIAQRGSVKVNKLYNIESYQTVHQMVSTVSCELKEGILFNEIMEATFPMASMTGAPKIKAMELIDSNENFKRNYYSGAMGFIEENGDFELAVTIRSIFYNERTKRLSIAVGSAITHLCDPEEEYKECLLKADALLKALNATIDA